MPVTVTTPRGVLTATGEREIDPLLTDEVTVAGHDRTSPA